MESICADSVQSLLTEGVISYLVSEDQEAQRLRDKFVFKIVPMLNPDGVINGRYLLFSEGHVSAVHQMLPQ